VPGAKSEHASFGSAVHEALKQFYDNSKLHSPYPTVEFFIEQFNHALHKEREVFTAESYGRFKEHGSRVLTAYYNYKFKNKKTENFILNEYRLDNVSLDDVPLKGFADLITFYGNDIIITDFKTGDPAKARAQFKRPGEDEKKPEGGNYWRQAVFYKLMVDRLPKNWKVQHAEFEFIEPDKKNKFDTIRVNISPEDEQKVALQITDAWEKIRKHDFYTGCGKEDCEWCRFSRDNRIYSRLTEEEAEKEELI
jgi:DNA helicase-2/ATP-dependent DNA helicase PcrA